MLDLDEVNRVVDEAAAAALNRARLSRVYSEPTTDSEGRDALHVTIVLRNNTEESVTGESALDAIVQIFRELSQRGEERFPIIDFATEDELDLDGDDQS